MTYLTNALTTASALSLALMTAPIAPMAHAAEMGDQQDTVKLAVLEWTGAQISTHVAGQLLEKLGYDVDYVTAGNFPQFTGLSDGTLSASVEVWLNNVGEVFPKAMEAGDIVNIGSLGLQTREGWVYPVHMEEICPGLPDWQALKEPACVQALMTPETAPQARFLDYPSEWGSRATPIIENNDLPYTPVPAGSEGALVAELEASAASQSPLIMMFWAPHYALAETDVGWVDMPPCEEQASDQCITPPDVAKVAWSGFEEKWPAAHALLEAFEMNAEDQQEMMLKIDQQGEATDAVAAEWIENHEDVWQPWIEAANN